MIYYIGSNYSDELYHYGVLGMHWGVRRYQNYDGTRIGAGEPAQTKVTPGMKSGRTFKSTVVGGQGGTAKGTARIAAAAPNMMSKTTNTNSNSDSSNGQVPNKKGFFDRSIKNGKGRENTSPAEELAKGVRDASRNAKPLVDVAEKHDPKLKEAKKEHAKKAKQEVSQMSDRELRDKINRIKMEREYKSLTEPEVETGYDKARDFLEVAGDIASIAVSIATFIAIIHKLRHEDLDEDTAKFMEGFENILAQDALTLDEIDDEFLEHHGVKGMHWGVRRYQNQDGTRIGTARKKPGEQRAENMFRNSVAGGQGGKATGTARLAASASRGLSSFRNSVAGGQGGKAIRTEKLAAMSASQKKIEEVRKNRPPKYDLQDRAYDHALLVKAWHEEKDLNRKKQIEKVLDAHEKESVKLYDDNEKFRNDFHRAAGSVDDYVPNKNAKGRANGWINKKNSVTISDDEHDWLIGYKRKHSVDLLNPVNDLMFKSATSDNNLKKSMTKRDSLSEINRKYSFGGAEKQRKKVDAAIAKYYGDRQSRLTSRR